jgi:hypothetical protein
VIENCFRRSQGWAGRDLNPRPRDYEASHDRRTALLPGQTLTLRARCRHEKHTATPVHAQTHAQGHSIVDTRNSLYSELARPPTPVSVTNRESTRSSGCISSTPPRSRSKTEPAHRRRRCAYTAADRREGLNLASADVRVLAEVLERALLKNAGWRWKPTPTGHSVVPEGAALLLLDDHHAALPPRRIRRRRTPPARQALPHGGLRRRPT